MHRTMTLAQWWKSGARANPLTPLGLTIGREVAASAQRHVLRVALKKYPVLRPRQRRAFEDANHILMHAIRGDGTCSKCPAYLRAKEAPRA